jgi:hypothetical protein
MENDQQTHIDSFPWFSVPKNPHKKLGIRGIGRLSVLGAVAAVVVADGAEVEGSAVVGNTEHPKHAQARTKKGSSPEVESGTLYLAPSAAKPTAQTGSSETSMVEQDSSVEKSLCTDKI